MTQAQNLANMSQDYGVIPMSCRNYIVDGAMEVINSNASTSVTNVGGYLQNAMYSANAGTGGAATCQPMTTVAGGPPNTMSDRDGLTLQWVQTTASTGTIAASTAGYIYNKVESARSLQNRSATFSLWIQNYGSAVLTIPQIIASQNFGSGGSSVSPVNAFHKPINWNVPADSMWHRYSVRLDVPSVNGKTFGTNNNDCLQIGIWLPPGVTFSFKTTQWQLEQSNPLSSSDINGNGGEPTAFEYRGPAVELMRAQRYFQAFAQIAFNAPTSSRSFPPMRTIPALSVTSFNAGTGATYASQDNASFWQNTAHSQIATANIVLDARF